MFHKIRYKLFLAILIANSLLLIIVYFSANWIFNTSFRDYLDQAEADRLNPLVQKLVVLYQQHGHWRWIRNRSDRSWPELVHRYATDKVNHRRRPPNRLNRPDGQFGEFSPDRRPPPPDGNPPGRGSSLLLRNAANKLIIGNPRAQDDAYWIPIEDGTIVLGYLGFLSRFDINDKLDQLFTERVEKYLSWLLLGMLFITALVAIPLAGGLVRPIEKLRLAFRELASGNYRISLEKHGNDEIGDLQLDFNRLANTMNDNLQARQRWIADISHELRTPIAVLQGELEAIIDGVRTSNPVSLRSLHQEVLRLTRLVNDLHELSLSDLGALSYHNREVDISLLIRSIVEQQTLLLERNNISFNLNTEDVPMVIFADAQRLEQLFTNLANNSRYYSAHPGRVEILLTRSGSSVCIDWSDSAPGVSDVDLDHLFDRLYRVDASRTHNKGGSGLGLSICKNIVEATGGSIIARHSSFGGVSITISFPLVK